MLPDHVISAINQGQATYAGEALLKNKWWSEKAGNAVTFELEPSDAHPFKTVKHGENGQRFALLAVPIGDDEQVDRNVANDKGGPLSQEAGRLCKEKAFQEWFADGANEAETTELFRGMFEIESRKELDHCPDRRRRFRELADRYYIETGRRTEMRG